MLHPKQSAYIPEIEKKTFNIHITRTIESYFMHIPNQLISGVTSKRNRLNV